MKFDFVVLGATGLQGKIASRDLLENGYSVLLCGRNEERVAKILNRYKKSRFEYVDLRDIPKTVSVIKKSGARIVLNCAEGDWDLNALKAATQANASSLDLGSEIPMTQDQLAMHSLLQKKKLVHITGCGSVPGIGNVMLRYAAKKLDTLDTIEVGFAWNSNIPKFVVPFSMESIIEEFTEPATNIERGKFTKIRPLSTVHHMYDPMVGSEDGLYVRHPETYTFYHYYKRQGLKNVRFIAEFPPHSFDVISNLITLGFGSKEPLAYNKGEVKPVKFVTELFKRLEIPAGYEEKEDLWLTLTGKRDGKNRTIKMQCYVPTLKGWKDAGCNIDTGMTISIMAQMVHTKAIIDTGSYAPEAVVPSGPFFKELAKRKMKIFENGTAIN